LVLLIDDVIIYVSVMMIISIKEKYFY